MWHLKCLNGNVTLWAVSLADYNDSIEFYQIKQKQASLLEELYGPECSRATCIEAQGDLPWQSLMCCWLRRSSQKMDRNGRISWLKFKVQTRTSQREDGYFLTSHSKVHIFGWSHATSSLVSGMLPYYVWQQLLLEQFGFQNSWFSSFNLSFSS